MLTMIKHMAMAWEQLAPREIRLYIALPLPTRLLQHLQLAYAGGNISSNFTAGNYEYVVATGPITGGSVPISTGLVNSYYETAYGTQGQRTYQVVRVPQYSNATLSGTVTGLVWNGSTGGIVVFDVAGQLNWNGQTIDVSSLGFRGGGGRLLTGAAGTSDLDYRTLATTTTNGSKGEGYAGTPRYVNIGGTVTDTGLEGYPSGSYGRGADGNGGGGSTDGDPTNNDDNSGGGGGGNGGFGGMGGWAWNTEIVDGGFGGAPFPGTAPRLILGGGGGAGTENNQDDGGYGGAEPPSSGAAGGGIAFVRAGTITGTGTINASGATAANVGRDGGGGGGAGGSVVVIAKNGGGSVGTLTVTANGGKGGDAWDDLTAGTAGVGTGNNHHGPGGGGGGGFVYTSGAVSGTSGVAGGSNGTSTQDANAFGATPGSAGDLETNVTPANIPLSISGANCVPITLTTVKTTSTPNVVAGNTATYTITVSNASGAGGAAGVTISDPLPAGFTYASTSSIVRSGNAVRALPSDPTVGAVMPSWGTFLIPGGGSVQITFTVNVSGTTPAGTYQNPATATYSDPTRTLSSATLSSSYNPNSSTGEDVNVTVPAIAISKTPAIQTISSGSTANFTITVTNTGTTALSGVSVTDALAPGCAKTIGAMAVGANSTYTCSLINVTSGFTNVATVTGTASGSQVSATSAGAVVNIAGSQICGLSMVTWGFESGSNTTGPNYDLIASDVSTAVASAGSGLQNAAIAATGNPPTAGNRWQATNFDTATSLNSNVKRLFSILSGCHTLYWTELSVRCAHKCHCPGRTVDNGFILQHGWCDLLPCNGSYLYSTNCLCNESNVFNEPKLPDRAQQ